MRILLGENGDTGEEICLEPDWFRTHMHLIGSTGAGKTSAIHTILQSLMLQTRSEQCCLFVVDPMGNLSHDLLRFISDEKFCPQHVRERLVYFEPARGDVVSPFNPLHHTDESSRYYQVMRAVDIILRAWSAQNVAEQPRLLQWTYKAFAAAAAMGFPISVCRYLLHPGSDLHNAILEHMPGEIRLHWQEILKARGGEAVRILESTRNRLDPFFESPNLRYMFGVSENRFDCSRFIQDRRIVIFNLAKLQRLPGFVADTIGSLVLNEIFETAVGLTTTVGKNVVDPTYILLDEFQKYVSQDIEDALPTVRQMGLRLILAHQSFAQLQTEAIDLEQMIWQARMRLMFASNAKDADLLADEIAKLTFDSRRIKEVRKSRRQLIAGYESRWTRSESNSSTSSSSDAQQHSESEGDSQAIGGKAGEWFGVKRETNSSNKSLSMSVSKTHAESSGKTEGRSETLMPIHENFEEVSNVDYYSFEEQSLEWGKRLRSQRTGEAILQLPNQSGVQPVKIDYFELENTPATEERIQRMVEDNFASEFFMPIAEAEARHERCLQDLLAGKLRTIPSQLLEAPKEIEGDGKDSPFSL